MIPLARRRVSPIVDAVTCKPEVQSTYSPGPFRPAKLRVFLDAMAEQVRAVPSLTTS